MQLEPYHETPDHKVKLYCGHVLEVLGAMSPESVHCVVTSPPYHWSLRKYDCEPVIWGGDPNCPHTLEPGAPIPSRGYVGSKSTLQGSTVSMEESKGVAGGYTGKARWQHDGVSRQETPEAWVKAPESKPLNDFRDAEWSTGGQPEVHSSTAIPHGATCSLCGAWLGQYGLEPTPELYVEHTMMWMHEVRRVLRKDGTCWLNLGDGYAGGNWRASPLSAGSKQATNKGTVGFDNVPPPIIPCGLKPKDAVLMPFRVALAAQAEGWWVRSVIIWHKPNPMPESVRDRPTDAHEYIFLLTKSKTYWYDAEAIREEATEPRHCGKNSHANVDRDPAHGTSKQEAVGNRRYAGFNDRYDFANPPNGRNCRSVWTFPTEPFPDAHFAVFPRELPERCIKAGAPVDGVVLDPFAGSGTTCEVAYHLGRTAIGIDASAKYLDMAKERVKQGALL